MAIFAVTKKDCPKDAEMHDINELKKELGNVIFSTIRWCDDEPEQCIELGIKAQKNFPK